MLSASPVKGCSEKTPVHGAGHLDSTRDLNLPELIQEEYEEESNTIAPRITLYWVVTLLPFFMLSLIALAVMHVLSN